MNAGMLAPPIAASEPPSCWRADDADIIQYLDETVLMKDRGYLTGAGAFVAALVLVGGAIYARAGTLRGVSAGPATPNVNIATPPVLAQAAPPASPPAQAPGTIYRCQVNGQTVYANEPCGSDSRAVDVFTNKGFEPTDTSTVHAPAEQEAPAPPATASVRTGPTKEELCHQTDDAIRANAETARRAQPGWRQDDLTAERRRLLDRKDELGCR